MTKRILALILVCILAIPIFAIPASATTYTGEYDYSIWYELSRIYEKLSGLVTSFGTYLNDIWQEALTSNEWLQGLSNYISMLMEQLAEYHEDITSYLSAIYVELVDGVGVLLQTISDSLSAFSGNFTTFTTNWKNKFDSLYNGLLNGQVGFIPRIYNLLYNIWNGSGKTDSEDFENQVSTESTEFQENMDIIDEWTRPDYEADFDPSVDEITGGEDIGDYTTALGHILGSTSIFPVLLFMAFSFSAISFVVFGKR